MSTHSLPVHTRVGADAAAPRSDVDEAARVTERELLERAELFDAADFEEDDFAGGVFSGPYIGVAWPSSDKTPDVSTTAIAATRRTADATIPTNGFWFTNARTERLWDIGVGVGNFFPL